MTFIIHNAAFVDHGRIISLGIQMQAHGYDFDDRPVKDTVLGKQAITSTHGHKIPFEIEDGLPYINERLYTDDEWLELPHVELTSTGDWDLSILNHKQSVDKMKHSCKAPMPIDLVAHLDYNIEGKLTNEATEINQSNLEPRIGFQDTISPSLGCNIHLYAIESFTRDKLLIFNVNTSMTYNI